MDFAARPTVSVAVNLYDLERGERTLANLRQRAAWQAASAATAARAADPLRSGEAAPGVTPLGRATRSYDLEREERNVHRLRQLRAGREAESEAGWRWMFGSDGLTFADIIDVINPLQHLPVVSTVYRWLTGDTISPAARMAGAALYGGPVGFAGAIANLAIEDASGRDLGDHALALLFDGDSGAEPTDVAAAAGPGLSLMPAAAAEPPTETAMERAIDRYRARIGGGGDHGERRSVDHHV